MSYSQSLSLIMVGPLTEPVRLVAMTHRSSLTALGGLPTVAIMSCVPLLAPQMLSSLVYTTQFLFSFMQGFGGHLEVDWPPVFLNRPSILLPLLVEIQQRCNI